MNGEKLHSLVDRQMVIDLATEMIDTPSATGEEGDMARLLERMFKEVGLSVHLQNIYDDRYNAIGRLVRHGWRAGRAHERAHGYLGARRRGLPDRKGLEEPRGGGRRSHLRQRHHEHEECLRVVHRGGRCTAPRGDQAQGRCDHRRHRRRDRDGAGGRVPGQALSRLRHGAALHADPRRDRRLPLPGRAHRPDALHRDDGNDLGQDHGARRLLPQCLS